MKTIRLLILIFSIALTLYAVIPGLAWRGTAAPTRAQQTSFPNQTKSALSRVMSPATPE